MDDSGNFYITSDECQDNIIRKVTPDGVVSDIAGNKSNVSTDGIGTSASFNWAQGIIMDPSGNIYVSDHGGNKIRKITIVNAGPPVINLNVPGNLCLGSGVNYQPTTTGSQSSIVLKLDSLPVSAPKAICKNDSLVFVVNANDSILCFNFSGKLVKVYNTMPNFLNVRAIAADNQNRVYVVAPDLTYPALTSVYRLDSASNWDFTFGSSGSTASSIFSNISAISLGPDGYLYAADTTNGDISIIDTSTAQATKLPSPSPSHSFYKPVGMTWGQNKQLYVADAGLNKILVRNAADNNYYDALPGLDTLKWKINSIDIDTNALYPEFLISSNKSGSPVVSFTNGDVSGLGLSKLIDYNAVFNFGVVNPAGLVNTNGSGLAPITWVANTAGNNVKRLQVYAYTITPKLPKGLYFNLMDGTIAGVPTEAIPPTTFTVTTQSTLGTATKKITFGVTPSTLLSNSPGTRTSLKKQTDGMKITYTDPSNCSKMVSIDDNLGGTKLGEVQVKQTVYPTVATFSTSSFVGRKTEINTQDSAIARLKLYFTYQDIDNYNKFTTGAKLSNDTIGGTMLIGVLQLHTDSTGHIEQIKHNPIAAKWIHRDKNWEVNFQVDKFSTFYAAESGSLDSFSCANTGKDSVVSNKSYYIWHGDSLKASGTYYNTFVNRTGCDSVVTLKLTITCTPSTGKDSIVSNKPYYVWHGDSLKTSGTFVDTFTNKAGCDSIVTLKLTIACANTGKDSIVSDSSYYLWHGKTLKASGTYMDTLVNRNGCDSVVTLKLTLKGTGTGIADKDVSSLISIYPNPSSSLFTLDLGNNVGTVNYTISSIDGRVILQKQNISGSLTTIDLNQEGKGIYFLTISGQDFIRVFKLIKE
jgi:hypothetical protein